MIRLTPALGNVFYALLKNAQWGGVRSAEVVQLIGDRFRGDDEGDNHKKESAQTVIFRKILQGEWVHDDPNFTEITTNIGKALTDDNDFSDGALMGELIGVLTSPQARNVLSGAMLTRLRLALLLPEEMIAVRRSLAAREMACAACGHGFQTGEMGSWMIHTNSGGSSSVGWVCTRCQVPSSTACGTVNCQGHLRFTEKLMQMMRGKLAQTCDACRGKKVEEGTGQGLVGIIPEGTIMEDGPFLHSTQDMWQSRPSSPTPPRGNPSRPRPTAPSVLRAYANRDNPFGVRTRNDPE